MAKILQIALQNYTLHMKGREFPKCFTEREFKAWSKHEAEIHTQPIRGFACRDCTVQYQKEMSLRGLCVNSRINLLKIAD
jgi:hypothetical protein